MSMTSVPISKFQLTNTLDRYCEPKSAVYAITVGQYKDLNVNKEVYEG